MLYKLSFVSFLLLVLPAEGASSITTQNIIRLQLKSDNWTHNIDQVFFRKYKLFCESADIQKTVSDFKNVASPSEIIAVSKKIEKLINLTKIPQNLFPSKKKLSAFILLGCGKTDAYALLSDDRAYVFFDVFTLFKQKRQSSVPRTFIVHELMHGLHFLNNPEFALQNYNSPEDHLLKSMIAEGFSTYLTVKLTPDSEKTAFWGELLNDASFKVWESTAGTQINTYASRIEKYLKNPASEPNLRADLLYVLDMKNIESKRLGYFYGYQITKNFLKSKLSLNFKYSEIRPEILRYFNIK